MKIAVSAAGTDLDAMVDRRFGRCQCFLIVDTEDMTVDVLENSAVALGSGAGIQAAQNLAEKGVTHVLTGNCGPKAHQALTSAGIGVIVDCAGRVRDVVAQFKTGPFSPAQQPNVADPSAGGPGVPVQAVRGGGGGAMGMGRGMGMGKGGGRGKGCGGGLGAGGGQGRRRATEPLPSPAEGLPDIDLLKRQAVDLEQQHRQIKERIEKLES
jgi:predicted Fe-Mo cluster-binding NifX family protein